MDTREIKNHVDKIAYVVTMCRRLYTLDHGIHPEIINDLTHPLHGEQLEKAIVWLNGRTWSVRQIQDANRLAGYHFLDGSVKLYPSDIAASTKEAYWLLVAGCKTLVAMEYSVLKFYPATGYVDTAVCWNLYTSLREARRTLRTLLKHERMSQSWKR